jgi:phosphoadenylyl-sulfate reductase (thioredoxin)
MSALVDYRGEQFAESWVFVGDDDPVPANGDIVVSQARLIRESDALLARAGRLGVRVAPSDAVENIAALLSRLDLVEIEFPAFRDGRGFSSARLVRERYGYAGDVRAVGDVLEDQIFFMLRCGFTSFDLRSPEPQAVLARAAKTFSLAYQSASDARAPVHDLRLHKAARRENQRVSPLRALPRAAIHDDFARAAKLAAELEEGHPEEILRVAIEREFPGRIALVSSFGAESAALLHLVSVIDRTTPVIFIDTDKHFAQTLQYRDELIESLKLADVRIVKPEAAEVAAEDPKGDLWRDNPDACCTLRKVRPNERALVGFDAWISGRKRHHGGVRARLPVAEHDGAFFKINPLAAWTPKEINAYVGAHKLPRHPLVEQGFPSIGCWPCTSPTEGTDARAGRWAGSGKTECGIHRPPAAEPGIRRLAF